jgi:tripartite-type tricarboxylate transporter receptor subunit TctC
MIRIVFIFCMLFVCPVSAWAQQCSSPIRMIVGLSAGGGLDAVARMLAQRFAERFGETMIVENKVGATGNIAAQFVAKAPHDGCTLIIRGNEHNVNPLIYSSAGYEAKDFDPVIRVLRGPAVLLAGTNQPFKTLADMVRYAKANPGKLSYGTSGIGSANHVAMELFVQAAKIDVVHVPYKGAAPALADTAGGTVPLSMGSIAAAQAFITSGKLIALAVTGPHRWPTLPDVPTLVDAGYPSAVMENWNGIFTPAGTPLPIREKLNREFRLILEEPAIRERLLVQGFEPVGGNIDDLRRFMQEDERASRELMQALKLKVD